MIYLGAGREVQKSTVFSAAHEPCLVAAYNATEQSARRKTTKQSIALIVSLALTFAAAGIGSLATTPNIPTWYAGLAKPTWNPPNWIFGPVWTFLYISMAVAAWLVWRQGGLWQWPLPYSPSNWL